MEEIWKDIVGYEGLYQVSNLGRVKSLCRVEIRKDGRLNPIPEKILGVHTNGAGHLKTNLSKNNTRKKLYIHRLLAEAFIPNPHQFSTVNHKDGNRSNNTEENIEWCSQRENVTHGQQRRKDKTSRFPGIHLNKRNTHKKWKAMLFVNGKANFIGNFYSEEEANEAYQKALIDFEVNNKYAKVA